MIRAQQVYIETVDNEVRTIEEFTELRDGFAVGAKTYFAVLSLVLANADGVEASIPMPKLHVPIAASTIEEAFARFDRDVEANVGAAIARELTARQAKPKVYGQWKKGELGHGL